jgi:hypothetical protein
MITFDWLESSDKTELEKKTVGLRKFIQVYLIVKGGSIEIVPKISAASKSLKVK